VDKVFVRIKRKMSDNSWGNLVGMTGEEAKQIILQAEPSLLVQVMPEDSMMTMDYRTDRVRVFVDGANKVVKQPNKG